MQSIGSNQNITIGTVIEHHETINKTTNIYQTLQPVSSPKANKNVKFNNKRGNKINLYKVIYSLIHNDFFVNEHGQQPNQYSTLSEKCLVLTSRTFRKTCLKEPKERQMERNPFLHHWKRLGTTILMNF